MTPLPRTRDAWDEIRSNGGLARANSGVLARASALQFDRNRRNEQLARGQAMEATTEVARHAQVAERVRDEVSGSMER